MNFRSFPYFNAYGLSHAVPPAANGLDGKSGCIVIHTDTHPPRIAGDIVNSVRRGTTQFRDRKIVHQYFLQIAFGTQSSAAILEMTR